MVTHFSITLTALLNFFAAFLASFLTFLAFFLAFLAAFLSFPPNLLLLALVSSSSSLCLTDSRAVEFIILLAGSLNAPMFSTNVQR